MGSKIEDTITSQMEDILHLALALRDATGAAHQPSRTPITPPSLTPSPPPLLPFLLEAGLSREIATAASKAYQLRSDELRQLIQESIVTACHKIAELPMVPLASSPDSFIRNVVSTFTKFYVRRLEEWKEEITHRLKQTSKTTTNGAPKNTRTFNHEYLPLLEHFFEENPFPTRADKIFLAKKSNMEYRQIHVWFQNRRNRTKKEGKNVRKKPICEGTTKPSDKLYGRMKGYMIESCPQAPKSPQLTSSEGTTERTEATRSNASKDALTVSSPPHAFPSVYPPTCHYDPFPCKSGPVSFGRPEWRRVPNDKCFPRPSTGIDDLVEKFSHLNIRDATQYNGSPESQSCAATAAITVVPSRAPHPSLTAHKYFQPTNIVQLHPPVRAPVSYLKPFQSPCPTSKSVTLAPHSAPTGRSGFHGKRKIARLPQRVLGRIQNTRQESESSSTSSSPRLSSTDSEGCSGSSSVSSLSTPSDMASIQELPYLFGSPCPLPFDSPLHLRGFGDMVAISSIS